MDWTEADIGRSTGRDPWGESGKATERQGAFERQGVLSPGEADAMVKKESDSKKFRGKIERIQRGHRAVPGGLPAHSPALGATGSPPPCLAARRMPLFRSFPS